MYTHSEIARTLRILAGYSFVYSILVGPLFLGSDDLWGAVTLAAIATAPSLIYWILARELLLSGWAPWTIHFIFIVLVAPLTLVWLILVGAWAWSHMVI